MPVKPGFYLSLKCCQDKRELFVKPSVEADGREKTINLYGITYGNYSKGTADVSGERLTASMCVCA